jgi:tetratricopeptide (TPR) repeat protein
MYFELGDYEKAKENLVKAKDYDYYPIRALSIINEFIRSQAKQDNVFLIDIEEIFMKNSPQGITGYELIGDFCHPAYPGSSLIAKNIQDILVRDILKEAEVLTARNGNCYEDEFLQSKGFNQKNSKIRLEYLLKLGNFCIAKGNYKIARKYLQEASQIDSTDWKITSDLATIDIFSGEIIKGFAGMKKAIRLKGSSIDFSNLRESGFIQEALKNQGITLDKLEEELSSSRM